jgi:hypothetical protein
VADQAVGAWTWRLAVVLYQSSPIMPVYNTLFCMETFQWRLGKIDHCHSAKNRNNRVPVRGRCIQVQHLPVLTPDATHGRVTVVIRTDRCPQRFGRLHAI